MVTDFYYPHSGGVEIHVRTIAHELARRGHEVAVATLPTEPGQPERDADGPVKVFTVHHAAERLGARFNVSHRPWAPPFPDPLAMKGLRAAVKDFDPDVIHGHDWLSRSVLPAAVSGHRPILTSLHYYTRTCAKKTLWTNGAPCPGPSPKRCLPCAADHYGAPRGAVVTAGLRIGAQLEDRRTRSWISVSAATEAGNGLDGRSNSVVIANPMPFGRSAAQAPAADAPLPVEVAAQMPDGDYLLFVGDIRPEKGVTVLAEAVRQLRERHGDNTPFVAVGERMSQTIDLPSNTIELGHVPNEVVQQLWSRATVGAVPSVWPEPFGLVAIEAMAAGCPLVASDVGGLSEILADGRALLVEPNNPTALADGLASLLADPQRRAEIAEAARAATDAYAVGPVVDKIEAQYRMVLAANSTSPSTGRPR